MNSYKYEDLYVGLQESFQVTISEQMLQDFASITGDVNPLHCDQDFARKMGYENKVTYGMLTASFLSTLAGVYLPGKYSLIYEVDTKFLHPVMIGDTLEMKGIVEELNDTFRMFVMKVQIVNQNGKKVLKGKMKVGVLDENR